MSQNQAEITQMLLDWQDGKADALDQLMPVVYDELLNISQKFLNKEREGHTLDAPNLVNEVYMKLINIDRVSWKNRAHFFGFAAQMMRQVLTSYARGKNAAKRGGDMVSITLDRALNAAQDRGLDIADLDQALIELEKLDPRKSKIVEMKFFGGLEEQEISQVLEVSASTIRREWRFARSWLFNYLNPKGS